MGFIRPYYTAKSALRQTSVDLVKVDFVASLCASMVLSCVVKVAELTLGRVFDEAAGALGWSLQFLIQVRYCQRDSSHHSSQLDSEIWKVLGLLGPKYFLFRSHYSRFPSPSSCDTFKFAGTISSQTPWMRRCRRHAGLMCIAIRGSCCVILWAIGIPPR